MVMRQRQMLGWSQFCSLLAGYMRGALALAIAGVICCAGALPAFATGAYQMPGFVDDSVWVIDDASQITRVTEGKLTKQLRQLSETTGDAVRFVTIHRLDYGETPQSFADQLFERWFPDPEKQIGQAVIVLDDVTNDAGIHVGPETDERLTAEIATSIVEETMKVPLLQGNQYSKSLLDATTRLVAVLSGEPDPGPPVMETAVNVEGTFATAAETEANRSNSTTVVVVLLVLATVIPMATWYWYQSMGG
ncbi:MAG: TPM domain-containing protein [Cyanobacteria bacterium P01_A01_bin.105]